MTDNDNGDTHSQDKDEILTEEQRSRLFKLGCIYYSFGLTDDAISIFYHIAKQNNIESVHYRPEEILQDIVNAVKVDEISTTSWTQLGVVFEKTGHRNLAMTAYLEASRLDSTNLQPLLSAYDAARSRWKARSILHQAIAINPDHPEVKIRVAEEVYAEGFKREALEIFLEAIDEHGLHEYAAIRIAEIETEMLESDGSFEGSRGYNELADWFG
jgi:tetratricopeptide (TPR) repeat protein